jgi:hypothetical protein
VPENDYYPIKNDQYCAWLLRVWYEQGHGWRISLQHVQTRERFGFDDLSSAMIFIEKHLPLSLTPPM